MERKRELAWSGSGSRKESPLGPFVPYTQEIFNNVEITSEPHPGWRTPSVGDVGGAFLLKKETYRLSPGILSTGFTRGPIIPALSSSLGAPAPGLVVEKTNSAMDQLGTSAISRSLPTNPSVDVANAIGEIRMEGVPRIPGVAMRGQVDALRKKSGSEYLNIEFGWRPLVSVLRDFAYTVKNHNKIIEGYRKGSDKKIRRRYAYPPSLVTNVHNGGVDYVPREIFSGFGSGTDTRTHYEASWFSGCFRYYVPVADSQLGKLAEYESYANKLLGLRLTPSTVWDLSPWSWALDWFGTTGDVLNNISSLGRDGLVMQYGYVMCESTTERHMSASIYGAAYSGSYKYSIKQRRRATPYGFGFDLKALTTRQTAVLVALGLARS